MGRPVVSFNFHGFRITFSLQNFLHISFTALMGGLLTSRTVNHEDSDLLKESQLSAKKLQCLRARFNKIDRESKGYLTRADFLALKGLALNPFADRVIEIFFQNSSNSGTVDASDAGLGSCEETLSFK